MSDAGKRTAVPSRFDGFVPQRSPIDAYGNGGFRFAGMSHRGSLLVLVNGMHAWSIGPLLAAADFEVPLRAVLERLEEPQFLLLGTGTRQIFPDARLRAAFLERHIGFDVMDTGAAARTYNVLLAEGRPVMAALVAVG
jgi:uncharacterized protein